jgi:serine phosphatase RsbU (regulator of sigma subunit)
LRKNSHKHFIYNLLAVCFVFILFSVRAQQVPVVLHGSSTTSDFVYDIEQDEDGVLYLATDMGLAAYDGRSFKNFGEEEGLKDNFITELVIFGDRLLMVHFEGGVSFTDLDGNERKFSFQLPKVSIQSVAVLEEYCYLIDRDGAIYELGLDQQQFKKVAETKDPVALAVHSNKLLVGTKNQIQVFDPYSHTFSSCILNTKARLRLFSKSREGSSNFYLDTDGNLFRVVFEGDCLKSVRMNYHPKADASFILESNDQKKLYISSMTSSIDILATVSDVDSVVQFVENIGEKNGLVKEMVKTLFMDAQGNLWIGGFGSGLSQVQLDNERSVRLGGRIISGFMLADRVHTTDGSQYYVLDPNSLDVVSTTVLSQKYGTWGLIRNWSANQSIAVLNGRRLFKYDSENQSLISELDLGIWDPVHVNDILIEGSRAVICSDAGLCIYDLEHDVFEVHGISTGLPANRTLTAARHVLDTTKLLIGFDGGSLMTLSDDKKLEEIETDILNYRINNLVSDASFLCFSAIGEGLYCDEGDGFKHNSLEGADELSENFMLNLKSDKNQRLITLSSDKVLVLKKALNRQFTVVRKNEGKAISCKDLLVYKDRVIFFSEESAYSFLVAKSGNALIDFFPVNITHLSVNSASFLIQNLVEIDPGDHKIQIDFNSPEFNPSKSVNYEYRLLGFDEQWTQTNENRSFAVYPKLGHGAYTFQVRILNQPTSLMSQNFVIAKPLWQRNYFIIGCIFILVTGVFLGFYYREQFHRNTNTYLDYQRHRLSVNTKRQKREMDVFKQQSHDFEERTKKLKEYSIDVKSSINQHIENAFVLDLPRKEIGGDFAIAHSENDTTTLIVADCSGHGASGATMGLICINTLKDVFKESEGKSAAQVLGETQKKVWPNAPRASSENRFGLVAAVCKYDQQERILEYAGANLSLVIISKSETLEGLNNRSEMELNSHHLFRIKASRLWWDSDERRTSFLNRKITLNQGDMVYLFTNGFSSQFGGPENTKIKSTQLKQLLIASASLDTQEQQQTLAQYFTQWKGYEAQTDDVLIVGFRA